jgi:phosphate transport system substrate-binding protein
VKVTVHARLAALAVAGVITLAACGSDNTGASDAAGGGGAAGSGPCASGTLSAEGSTAQQNAIEEVIASFQSACPDATVNYNPTGSGAGIKQFTAGQVDFAGSDSALKTEPVDGAVEADAAAQRCGGNPAWDLPMVAGPIALAYNLPGVQQVVLTPDLSAKILLGQVRTWNDPAITAVNPGTSLPSRGIKVFYRSDDSGTTENLEKYLAAAAPSVWDAKPSKTWAGAVGEGREKSAGVAEGVKSTEGAIGYMEWSFAKDNQLGVAQVDNGGGPVELTGDSAGKFVAVAKPAGEGNDLRLTLDYTTKAAGTYPIVLVTYEIVCSKGLPADRTALVKAFLTHFASPEVQSSLGDLQYAPLPDAVRSKVQAAIQAIS